MERGMFLYPWDLIDDGIDNVIAQLKNMGITYVSLAVLYHKAKLLLPHNPKHHLYMVEGNTCFYHIQQERYGRLKPSKSPILDSYTGDFLQETLEHFRKAHIRLGVWVVLFHNDHLADKYPDCAIQNCFGERLNTNLCPSNPEVYQYGLNVIEEILECGVDEIHLESAEYAGFLHGEHHEMQAFQDTVMLDRLMGACYCPYCREQGIKAGIDMDRLIGSAKQEAERFFHFWEKPSDHAVYEELFREYLTVKQRRIASFYSDVRKLVDRKGVNTKIKPILWMSGDSDPHLCGIDMWQLEKYVDGVITAYPDSDMQVDSFVHKIRKFVPMHMPVTGGVRLLAENTTTPGQIKKYIQEYADCGIQDLIFYNYGMAPLPFLQELEVGLL